MRAAEQNAARMMKRGRTPQEKKLLSYAKDGRNAYAESRGIAHRAITRRKAKANRALRRAESVLLRAAAEPDMDADIHIPRARRRSWKKIPDAPLAEYLAARLTVRERSGMNHDHKGTPLLLAGRKRARIRATFFKGSLRGRYFDPQTDLLPGRS